MVNFFLEGHSFEYEVRNVYRIFDLNSEVVMYFEKLFDCNLTGLIIKSDLRSRDNTFISTSFLQCGNTKISKTTSSEDIVLEKDNLLKLKKTVVKKALYQCLTEYFRESSKYGFLTGIRPGKIINSAVENGFDAEGINSILSNTYEMSEEKINLLMDIYKVQKKYINKGVNLNNYNLYIHIPFCPTRCSYCSFPTNDKYKAEDVDRYVAALCDEIKGNIQLAMEHKLNLNTVYFGGGTPSVLSPKNIRDIFAVISNYYDLKNINEITFEAGRPDTIHVEKLQMLKNNCVSRISINPQTMNEKTLKNVLRGHTVDDIVDKYNLARQVGFQCINMDLIIGLPGENEFDVENSIKEVIALKPENITVHALSYKRGSKLKKDLQVLTKDALQMENMYEFTRNNCLENDYIPYYMYRQKNIKGNLDNVGYSIFGKESIYNIVIIEELETIFACGAGGTSKILLGGGRHERVENFKGLNDYYMDCNKKIDKKNAILKYKYL